MSEPSTVLLPSSGVISLLSTFSVGCVLSGGRVSLAHLIEFSHFVDLYVLEDTIYINSSSKDVELEVFRSYPDCPFKELPSHDDEVGFSVGSVSDSTRALYDCSEINCSFSMDAYDYWLRLSNEAKDKIPTTPLGIRYFSRDYLLFESRSLEESMEAVLDQISGTKLTLMPSARNLLPFLEVFSQLETPAQLIYLRLTAAQRKLIDDVQAFARPRTVYLPP